MCPPLINTSPLVQHGRDDWTGKLSGIPCHHQPAWNPRIANQTKQNLLCCIKWDMLWPDSSGVFHVDTAALDLEFHLIRLIENIHSSTPSWLLYIISSQCYPLGWRNVGTLDHANLQYYLRRICMYICMWDSLCSMQYVLSGLMKYNSPVIFCVSFIFVVYVFRLYSVMLALWSVWFID